MTISRLVFILAFGLCTAQAHVVDVSQFASEEPALELEPRIVWDTFTSNAEGDHPIDVIARRARPWTRETLRFRDVYTRSYAPLSVAAGGNEPPAWIEPIYDVFVVASNMFATSTYWAIGLFILLTTVMFPAMKRAFRRMTGQQASRGNVCGSCQSNEIQRVSLGQGLLGGLRRMVGQRAFHCNSCASLFFRRWDYEGLAVANRGRVS